MAFLNSGLASAQEEQAQLAAPSQRELEEAPGPNTGGESVPVETHQTLQVAMDKLQVRECPPAMGRRGAARWAGPTIPEPACWLQSRFVELMQEKVDLKERVEELEHRCIQLSGETDTIGEYIALYQSQRAVLKQRHREKEEYINRLAQDKEEMKVEALPMTAGGVGAGVPVLSASPSR